MFLITGSASSSNEFMFVDQSNNSSNLRQPVLSFDTTTATGNIDAHQSISEILDSCVLYYYAVAHKYITMVNNAQKSFIEILPRA